MYVVMEGTMWGAVPEADDPRTLGAALVFLERRRTE